MLLTRLRRLLTAQLPKHQSSRILVHFESDFSAIYSILGLWKLSVASTSCRMMRDSMCSDAAVFRSRLFDNLIANYFQSVAPPGYTALSVEVAVGINHLLLNKVPPAGVLTTSYCFGSVYKCCRCQLGLLLHCC